MSLSAGAAGVAGAEDPNRELAPKTIVGENWNPPSGASEEEAIWKYLSNKEEKLDISKEEIKDQLKIVKKETDSKSGTSHYKLKQYIQGIPVYETQPPSFFFEHHLTFSPVSFPFPLNKALEPDDRK